MYDETISLADNAGKANNNLPNTKLRWFQQGACASDNRDWMTEQKKERTTLRKTCKKNCKVRIQCLYDAISCKDIMQIRFGVWGGATTKQMSHIRVMTSTGNKTMNCRWCGTAQNVIAYIDTRDFRCDNCGLKV